MELCKVCGLRPRCVEGTKTHPYCSRTCAQSTQRPQPLNIVNSGSCKVCHIRPRYSDEKKLHDYCSRTCAQRARAAILKETLCLMCHAASKAGSYHFCSVSCENEAERKGPMILEVPVGHVTFNDVSNQFKASWRHGTNCPPVHLIYKIIVPRKSMSVYTAYRASVESKGLYNGNERRRWHGTHRLCNLGDPGHTRLCTSSTCSLCRIIQSSYDISHFGKKTGWGRFGRGIYTSSTSSKSNDYSHNHCTSALKAIILNKVVVGKGCKLKTDDTKLTEPPSGFDSVLAEPGGRLNHDELIVYRNEAIRPSFLVMYESTDAMPE